MNRIVVFASGSGSNFQAIIDAVKSKTIDAKITGLITNKDRIKAIDRAKKADIPVCVIKPSGFPGSDEYDKALLRQLRQWNPSLIVLAGYMIAIPEQVVLEYRNRIINIHPSLLPKYGGRGFYGKNVHKAVLEAGDKVSGCSVHLVNDEYDDGPVIARKEVPVFENDTPDSLAERVLAEEHKLLPKVIATLLSETENP